MAFSPYLWYVACFPAGIKKLKQHFLCLSTQVFEHIIAYFVWSRCSFGLQLARAFSKSVMVNFILGQLSVDFKTWFSLSCIAWFISCFLFADTCNSVPNSFVLCNQCICCCPVMVLLFFLITKGFRLYSYSPFRVFTSIHSFLPSLSKLRFVVFS